MFPLSLRQWLYNPNIAIMPAIVLSQHFHHRLVFPGPLVLRLSLGMFYRLR